jgi:diguanylate cyclase (GGDEF)-like protein
MAKILIVDDDPTNRSLLVTLLGYRGHRTLEAGDGAEALALAKSWKPQLIVSDVLMPTMDGYEFVRLLREEPNIAAVPVMFYTAHYQQKQARALGKACGVDEILIKPAEPEDILRVVDRLLKESIGAPAQPPPDEGFHQSHLRILTDELSLKSTELEGANARLGALMDLNLRLASERDPPTLLPKVCHGARSLIGCQFAILAAREGGDGRAVVHLHSGIASDNLALLRPPALDRGRLAAVLRDGVTWRAAGLDGSPESIGLPSDYPAVHSALAVPIQSLSQTFGWLLLANKIGSSGFSSEDQRIIEILAAQVGRIYESGGLYRQVQRHAMQLQVEVAERKRSEEQALRLNRTYEMLSTINTLIIRATSSQELCLGACRTAVEHGGYSIAWIGMIDPRRDDLQVFASAQDQTLLGRNAPDFMIDISLREGSLAKQAVASCEPRVAADIADRAVDIRYRDRLIEQGCRGLAALPLNVEGQCVGCLFLFATHEGAFDAAEIRVLRGLSDDIAFGIDHLRKADRINYLAYYDTLTGIANRALFLDRLAQALTRARQEQRSLGLLVVDVERFHTLNEHFGRKTGDEVLRELARRIAAQHGDSTHIARIASNQFAILVPHARDESQMLDFLTQGLGHWVGTPFALEGQDVPVNLRSGMALSGERASEAEDLLKAAELALRETRQTGMRHAFYTQELHQRLLERQRMESQLRRALENGEFVLHYQPKVQVDGRALAGFEALIRWQNPELGLVLPARFIPLLEETGLIAEVGLWVLQEASSTRASWVAAGYKVPRVAINVSTLQLGRGDFAQRFRQVLGDTRDGAGLDIEVTESLIIDDADNHIEQLREIRRLGMRIAVDDFGTGYSSLGYLSKLPVQTLKIDRSFINTMLHDPGSMTLVSTIISLAHALKLSVVAEGVELEEQAKILRLLRCDEMQGYLISRPVPAGEVPAMLMRKA